MNPCENDIDNMMLMIKQSMNHICGQANDNYIEIIVTNKLN